MRKLIITFLAGAMLIMGMASGAYAIPSDLTYSFYYPSTALSWGTMTLSVHDPDSIKVAYTATTSPTIPTGSKVNAFGFSFSLLPDTTTNNSDTILWYEMNNPSRLPTPVGASGGFDFTYGVSNYSTGGNPNNRNGTTGILPGGTDEFYINFSGLLMPTLQDMTNAQFADFADFVGIRIMSISGDDFPDSLMLFGTPNAPVPEPGTMMLLGVGMLGLAIFGKRRMNK